MEMDIDFISIPDLILDVHWNLYKLHTLFCEHLNDVALNQGGLDYENANRWVWYPKSCGIRISSMVYSHFNHHVA